MRASTQLYPTLCNCTVIISLPFHFVLLHNCQKKVFFCYLRLEWISFAFPCSKSFDISNSNAEKRLSAFSFGINRKSGIPFTYTFKLSGFSFISISCIYSSLRFFFYSIIKRIDSVYTFPSLFLYLPILFPYIFSLFPSFPLSPCSCFRFSVYQKRASP